MQEGGTEQQDIAGRAAHHRGLRMLLPRRHSEALAAMGAGHHLRATIVRPKWIEEGQRGHRPRQGDSRRHRDAAALGAAARTGRAPFHLCQEERLAQNVKRRGQQHRQAAQKLHGGIEIEQGMTPGRFPAAPAIRSEGSAPASNAARSGSVPARRDGAAQQQIAFVVETAGVFEHQSGVTLVCCMVSLMTQCMCAAGRAATIGGASRDPLSLSLPGLSP